MAKKYILHTSLHLCIMTTFKHCMPMHNDFANYLKQEETIIHLLEHAHTEKEQQQLFGFLQKYIDCVQWRAQDFMRIAEKNNMAEIKANILGQLNIYNTMYYTYLQEHLSQPKSQLEFVENEIENYGLLIAAPLHTKIKQKLSRFFNDLLS